MKPSWITLLRSIGTVFVESDKGSKVNMLNFSKDLYKLAFVNKVVLTYLSRVHRDGISEKLFHYHNRRLNALMRVLTDVVEALDEHGFRYVVFKTLRPFREEVADIDILCLGDEEYEELVHAVQSRGYRLMERGLYCTTFEDPRYRFVTEVMIDVYREVSAGPVIYLDKQLLGSHVALTEVSSTGVKVLDPVAEILVAIGHSVVKERKMILADYLTVLHYLKFMSNEEVGRLAELARSAKLVCASRWFLTLALHMYSAVHGCILKRLVDLVNMLGGAIDLDTNVFENEPPFQCSREVLARVLIEKLRDPLFRSSIANLIPWLFKGESMHRLTNLLVHRL